MDSPNLQEPKFNPESMHRKQAAWQIYLPAALGGAIFVAICVWAALYTAGYVPEPGLPDQQTPAAKVAVIWLILPTCLGGLLQLGLLVALVFGLSKGIQGLPSLAHRIDGAIQRVGELVRKMSDKAASPVILIKSQQAGASRLVKGVKFWKRPTQGA